MNRIKKVLFTDNEGKPTRLLMFYYPPDMPRREKIKRIAITTINLAIPAAIIGYVIYLFVTL